MCIYRRYYKYIYHTGIIIFNVHICTLSLSYVLLDKIVCCGGGWLVVCFWLKIVKMVVWAPFSDWRLLRRFRCVSVVSFMSSMPLFVSFCVSCVKFCVMCQCLCQCFVSFTPIRNTIWRIKYYFLCQIGQLWVRVCVMRHVICHILKLVIPSHR